MLVLCAVVQIAKLELQLDILRKERDALVSKRATLEDEYRVFAINECDMEEAVADAKIKKAWSAPQKNKRLQAIHEAHKALLSKEAAIKDTEVELTDCKEKLVSKESTASLPVLHQEKDDKVSRLFQDSV